MQTGLQAKGRSSGQARRVFVTRLAAVAALAGGLMAGVTAPAVHAEEPYPSRPVKIIVPYPPGGTTDLLARAVAARLTESLKQSFVVENRHITTDQAEERVERQAREFELHKPYLVKRWNEAADRSNGS